jgi:DNA-directed RNA polymerase subunit RPC12/RpoP
MSVCPIDRSSCADRRCLANGCKDANGEPMLMRCATCRNLFNEDAADDGKCPDCAGKVQIGPVDA